MLFLHADYTGIAFILKYTIQENYFKSKWFNCNIKHSNVRVSFLSQNEFTSFDFMHYNMQTPITLTYDIFFSSTLLYAVQEKFLSHNGPLFQVLFSSCSLCGLLLYALHTIQTLRRLINSLLDFTVGSVHGIKDTKDLQRLTNFML